MTLTKADIINILREQIGLPKKDWHKNYLESLDDITSKNKNFLSWAQNILEPQ